MDGESTTVETLINPRIGAGAGQKEDGGVSAIIATANTVIGLITAIFSALQAGDQAKKLIEKWQKEAQLRKWWSFKHPVALPTAAGPVEIVISDVDDTANIWWNNQYLWTLNRGESRGFRTLLRPGRNVFWFELNNHGGHRFSLVADISQNGRRVQRASLQGDDEGQFHIATVEIIGESGLEEHLKTGEAASTRTKAEMQKLSRALQDFHELSGHLRIDGKRLPAEECQEILDLAERDKDLRRQLEEKVSAAVKEAAWRSEINQNPLQSTKMPIFPAVDVDTKTGWVDVDYRSQPPKA